MPILLEAFFPVMDLGGDAAEFIADLVERLSLKEAYVHQDPFPHLRILLRLVRLVEALQNIFRSTMNNIQSFQRLANNELKLTA